MWTITAVLALIAPTVCHRLIVGPPEQVWDSVIVTSDPIKITEGKTQDYEREPDYPIKLNEGENRIGRECKFNDIGCLYGHNRVENQEIIDRFLEQYTNRTEAEEKSQIEEKRKGWVTLETIPWSTSTVSKWQPNSQTTPAFPQEGGGHLQDRPWQYGGRPSPQRPAPVNTNYGTYVPASENSKPQWGNNDIVTDDRPSKFPEGIGGYQAVQPQLGSHHGYDSQQINQDSRPMRPGSQPMSSVHHGMNQMSQGYNIIQQMSQGHVIDHQPGQFQSHHEDHQMSSDHDGIHNIVQGHYGSNPVGPSHHHSPQMTRPHPSTYPESGNGEWVLLSTTKGYSLPSGYRGPEAAGHQIQSRQHPEISRYHEENIDVVEGKSDEKNWKKGLRLLHTEGGGKIYAAPKAEDRRGKASWTMEDSPLEILYSSTDEKQPTATLRRTVRLQVLPPAGNKTTLAHGGLLEVDSTRHSVDEEHKIMEEEKIKQLSKIAKVRRSNYTLYRVIPAPVNGITGRSFRDKSNAMLAAVGAGLIPATMAVLVPMALGRKKRSLPKRFSKADMIIAPHLN